MPITDPVDILKHWWGYEKFRPQQEDIIRSVLEGHDTLAILPTGGGKSICYQVPVLCQEGIGLVITPLIALMKDQVDQLREKNIPAYAIHSGMNKREIDITLDNCIFGKTKFLYVSPERLKTEIFSERVNKMNINLVAVDEAHCISQWGYDFRPSYLQISGLRNLLKKVPFLALTASATLPVRKDIVTHLEFRENYRSYVQSFYRPNLSYMTRKAEDKTAKLINLLSKVKGTAIIYTRSRNNTKKIAEVLKKNSISADFYHAGLTSEERNSKQEKWMRNQTRVMVSTNAFGMGINKPDVRMVIHMDLPENIESYYQEAGRAGRDGKKAIALILYMEKDKEDLAKRTLESVVDAKDIKITYQSLANYFKIAVGSSELNSYNFDLDQFAKVYNLNRITTFNALKKLEELGYLLLNESFYQPSRIIFNVDKEELYKFQIANIPYENLIKTLLRIFGGEIFSQFVLVNEKKVAAGLKSTIHYVEDQLTRLNQMGVLTYLQKKDHPQVTFLTPRQDANRLQLDHQLLESRKKLKINQMESMVAYLDNKKWCRSLFLQGYFGESSDQDCGICDLCLLKKRKDPDHVWLEKTRQKISAILNQSPVLLDALLNKFPEHHRSHVIELTRKMLDSAEIHYDEYNYLHLDGKK